jgi:membrane fusion protein (multidrug efflux system)
MRYLVVVLGLVAVVGGLATIKYKQIASLIAMGKQFEKSGPPPEAVSTATARQETWADTLNSVGSVAAAKGVTLSNDAPGVISGIHFESGQQVREGQVLVDLDSNVERAQLASAEARRELANVNVGRTRALVATDALPKAQQDNDEALLKTSHSDLNALQAQIARKVVRAPFSGRLGIRLVNLGQYLNPGTPIAVLEAAETVYVDFTLPQQRLASVPIGTHVRFTIEDSDLAPVEGTIAAIDPAIDPSTRSIKLRASAPNEGGKLLPGMFASVAVQLADEHQFVTVPASAVVHASYGDSVFVVEDKTDDGAPKKVARQQFVRLGEARGDFVSVLEGLQAGKDVVTEGAFKLRNGASVMVNNTVQPKAELSPHPENR